MSTLVISWKALGSWDIAKYVLGSRDIARHVCMILSLNMNRVRCKKSTLSIVYHGVGNGVGCAHVIECVSRTSGG